MTHRRRRRARAALGIVCATCLLSASAATAQAPAVITGSVAYRERVTLSPEATLDVILEDVSKADAPAEVIAERRLTGLGQVPIRFELPFDPTRIVPDHRYNLRLRITDRGVLRFVSTEAHPVITGGHGTTVEALLQAAAGPPPMQQAPPALQNTRWRLVRLGETPVDAPPGPREPHLIFRGTSVLGATGCNTLRGGFVAGDQNAIEFQGLLSTQMACPTLTEIEKPFLLALGRARTWRIRNNQLELLDDKDVVVAQFEAHDQP